MRKALVTGGAGFIGGHVVEKLVSDGWQVRVLDNLSTGKKKNLSAVDSSVELIIGDIRDLDTCQQSIKGVDTVFHLAAIASVAASVDNPTETHSVTLTGTVNLLDACRLGGVKRFVFTSSAAVYGDVEQVPTAEDQPLEPQSPYASAKAAGEMYCRNFHSLFGLETVILRYFNVFGPRQSLDSGYAAAIPAFISAALDGSQPRVFGDGLQTRDFVFVGNVADANLLAATVDGAVGQTFNIGGGSQVTLLDLLQGIEIASKSKLSPKFEAGRPGEVRHSRADIRRAQDTLGYYPNVNLAEGLRLTLEHSRTERA